jgi:predicted DNA-binding transcriptional regulator YafY
MSLHNDRLHRLTRLFLIAGHLQSGERVTLEGLAQLCNADKRTIQRDLEFLRDAGVEFSYNRQHRSYELLNALPFAPPAFSAPDLMALTLAQEAALGAGTPFQDYIRRAFIKVSASLPVALRQELEVVRDAITFETASHGDYDPMIFEQLREAQQQRETVQMQYYTRSRDETSMRNVDPYKLFWRNGFWMLIGHCHRSGSVRQFSLDAVRSLYGTGTTFTIPSDFNMDDYMRDSVGVLRGEPVNIVLRFDRARARYAERRRWDFTHTMVREADGSLTLRGTVSGLEEIRNEVLRWGEGITVLEPEELCRAVLDVAKKIAQKYEA